MALFAVPAGLAGAAVTYFSTGRAVAWSFVASAVPVWIALACLLEWQYQAALAGEPSSWRPRFRLGWAFIVLSLIGLWCGAMAGQRQAALAAQREGLRLQDALQAIVGAGRVHVNPQSSVIQVQRADFDDADLGRLVACLAEIGAARFDVTLLDLSGTQVTDQGLRHFDQGPRVRHLVVDRTRVTGLGLRTLPWLGELESLSFYALGLTADDVRQIRDRAPKASLGAP